MASRASQTRAVRQRFDYGSDPPAPFLHLVNQETEKLDLSFVDRWYERDVGEVFGKNLALSGQTARAGNYRSEGIIRFPRTAIMNITKAIHVNIETPSATIARMGFSNVIRTIEYSLGIETRIAPSLSASRFAG